MTISKKAKAEIATILPEAKTFTKRHVAGVGYVFFIKNAAGETLAKCFREFDGMKLMVNG